MLSDERIRKLALIAVKAQNWSPNVDQAIRLAVAETVEECATLCDRMASDAFALGKTMRSARAALDAQGRAHMDAAAAIREESEDEMSDTKRRTPRTDAKERETRGLPPSTHSYYGWKHARALERELAAANEAQANRDREAWQTGYDFAKTSFYDLPKRRYEECFTYLAAANEENAKLRAEVDRLREDAARYRWLASRAHKDTAYDRYGNGAHWIIGFFADDGYHALDAAIDAARKE